MSHKANGIYEENKKEYEDELYPYRKKIKECEKDGTRFKEKCHFSGGKEHIMCRKYGGYCTSLKCFDERLIK